MFNLKVIPEIKMMLLAGILASGIAVAPARAQSDSVAKPAAQSAAPATVATPAPARAPAAPAHSRYQPNRFSRRAGLDYELIWGVDSLNVKWTESGEVIRFAYRVLDGDKAMPLNDKKAEPSLIDPQAGVRLVVPSLEQVGMLRQAPTGKPVPGKIYWMAFSNKGRHVKRGDHVSVVIGRFHADGLVVD
jgi:hypothetical protein